MVGERHELVSRAQATALSETTRRELPNLGSEERAYLAVLVSQVAWHPGDDVPILSLLSADGKSDEHSSWRRKQQDYTSFPNMLTGNDWKIALDPNATSDAVLHVFIARLVRRLGLRAYKEKTLKLVNSMHMLLTDQNVMLKSVAQKVAALDSVKDTFHTVVASAPTTKEHILTLPPTIEEFARKHPQTFQGAYSTADGDCPMHCPLDQHQLWEIEASYPCRGGKAPFAATQLVHASTQLGSQQNQLGEHMAMAMERMAMACMNAHVGQGRLGSTEPSGTSLLSNLRMSMPRTSHGLTPFGSGHALPPFGSGVPMLTDGLPPAVPESPAGSTMDVETSPHPKAESEGSSPQTPKSLSKNVDAVMKMMCGDSAPKATGHKKKTKAKSNAETKTIGTKSEEESELESESASADGEEKESNHGRKPRKGTKGKAMKGKAMKGKAMKVKAMKVEEKKKGKAKQLVASPALGIKASTLKTLNLDVGKLLVWDNAYKGRYGPFTSRAYDTVERRAQQSGLKRKVWNPIAKEAYRLAGLVFRENNG